MGCKDQGDCKCGSNCGWFYLNYVGCKALTMKSINDFRGRFTLTMWDVKVRGIEKLVKFDISFTLTMWDVKSLTSGTVRLYLFVLP